MFYTKFTFLVKFLFSLHHFSRKKFAEAKIFAFLHLSFWFFILIFVRHILKILKKKFWDTNGEKRMTQHNPTTMSEKIQKIIMNTNFENYTFLADCDATLSSYLRWNWWIPVLENFRKKKCNYRNIYFFQKVIFSWPLPELISNKVPKFFYLEQISDGENA